MQPPWDAAQPPGVDEINQALGELGVDSEWLGVNGWVFGFTASLAPTFYIISGGNGNLQKFSVGLSGAMDFCWRLID